eukprot:c15804_g1_i1 orf=17-235(-)
MWASDYLCIISLLVVECSIATPNSNDINALVYLVTLHSHLLATNNSLHLFPCKMHFELCFLRLYRTACLVKL